MNLARNYRRNNMDWNKKLQELMRIEHKKAISCLNKIQLKHDELEQYYQVNLKRLASLKRKLKRRLPKGQGGYFSNSSISHSGDDELAFLETHLKTVKQELRLLEINEISLTKRITSFNQFIFSAEEYMTNTSLEDKYKKMSVYLQQCDQNFPLFTFHDEYQLDSSRSHIICQ